MLDELLILKKIKEGDIKAFEELFRRYYFPLLLLCGRHYRADGGSGRDCRRAFLCTLERKGALTDLSVR